MSMWDKVDHIKFHKQISYYNIYVQEKQVFPMIEIDFIAFESVGITSDQRQNYFSDVLQLFNAI